MDVDTSQLDREEKRRLRRERIKRILEDDNDASSTRSRTPRVASDDTLTRTSASRETTSSSVGRPRSRPELISSGASEPSERSARSRRAPRESSGVEATEAARSGSPSGSRARREARRRRNQEHDLAQNNLENGTGGDKGDAKGRSATAGDSETEVLPSDEVREKAVSGDAIGSELGEESRDEIGQKSGVIDASDADIDSVVASSTPTENGLSKVEESVQVDEGENEVENGIVEEPCKIEEITERVELVEGGANMIGVKDSAESTTVDGDKSHEIIDSKATDLGVQVDEKVGVGESETSAQKEDGLRGKRDAKNESEPTIVEKNIGKRESELDGKKDKNEGPDEGHKRVPRSGLGGNESAESKSKIGDLKEKGSPKLEKASPTSTGQNIAKTKLDSAKDEKISAKDKGGGVHDKKSDTKQKEEEKTKEIVKDIDSVIEQKDALMEDKKDSQTETTSSDAKKAFKEMSSEEITVPEKTENVHVVEKGFAEATQEETLISGKALKDEAKVNKDEVLLQEQSDKGKRIIEEKTSVKESGKEKSSEDQVPLPGSDSEAKKVVDVSVKENESKDGEDTKDLTDGSGESKNGLVKQESPKSDELSTGKELENDKQSKGDSRAIKAPIKKDSSPRKGKLKMDGDSWKKDARKKRGTADRDRFVEITVLSRTGKLKDKLKSCESRDVESSDQWKKEVKKTAQKHKSLDEDAEKELKELSRRRELKERVQACNEKDKETASAWTKEIKTKSQKSLDEETESELNEIAKESKLKNRLQECQERDEESTNAFKKIIKKDAKKTLDADTESELRAIAQSGALKNRIEECEGKDKESVDAWKKEVKKGDVPPKISEVQTGVSDEMKEFAESGRLKTLIESCADREGQEGRSWKAAKKSEHEDLKELAKTVDVKSRIKSKVDEQERQPEGPRKGFDPHEDEELKEINLKGRIEAYGEEVVKVGATGEFVPIKEDATAHDTTAKATAKTKGKTLPGKNTGKISPPKLDGGRASPTKKGTKKEIGRVSPSKMDPKRRASPTKREPGRTSPAKLETGRMSPAKKETGRTSPTKRDTGRISPTKGDTSSEAKADGGRTSPAKLDLKGKTAAAKKDATGRSSPVKDKAAGKSKLADIRSNLLDGGKGKIKSKRESLERVTKKAGIKDKIAACKQRDKSAPARQLPVIEKAPVRPRPKTAAPVQNEAVDLTPVNRAGEETGPEQEEPVDVDMKGKMSYWEAPKTDGDETAGGEVGANEGERPAPVILGNVKQAWEKKNRKIKTGEFVKALLDAKCKRRDLKDIADVKSDTKKYLVLPKSEPQEDETKKEETKEKVRKSLEKNIETQNKKNVKKSAEDETKVRKTLDDFSLDDIANPDEVKQLQDITSFRRHVRPTNRRAAKSNPLKQLQQRKDIKSGIDIFNAIDDQEEEEEEEEEEALVPTAVGRLGKPVEPGDRRMKVSTFARDALAGLSAKEDMSKISLKKTAKSRKGVSQEKNVYDGTAPVMLIQIKGHRHLQTRLVEPSCESLNSGDAFLAMVNKNIYVWVGKDSNVMKKSKASEISNIILQYKLLNCASSVITNIRDSNVNVGTGLRRNFWDKLGGQTKIKGAKQVPQDAEYEKAVVSTNIVYEVDASSEPTKLEKCPDLCGKIPSITMLDSDKAFVFDFGTEVYVWLGRTCDATTRTKAAELGQETFKGTFHVECSLNPITPNNPDDGESAPQEIVRPEWAIFGRMTERAETILFQEKFSDWPDPKTKEKLDKQKDILNKNLSGGYEKRKAQLEPKEVQIVELVPFEGQKMAEKPAAVEFVLEGVNVARGRGSYDEVERRSLSVTTNSVTVYHSSDKEYRQLEEKEWGHFYSAESYVIRWSYCVRASGVRSLKGGESKHDDKAIGRDMIAYFFWHGRDCSASGKGTSALATIELDSDKSPQIMVDEGTESACFLNMFDGQMVVHHGKLNDKKTVEEDNVLMYCVQHEDERETSFIQTEARSCNLRSRSSYIIAIIEKSVGVCVWHGCKSTKEKKDGALRGAKRLAVWFQGLFDLSKCDIIELDEGNEGTLFWEALDGKSEYGSLAQGDRKSDNRLRLFYFTSSEGPFVAKEVVDPTRGELVAPYPFSQSELYFASQPALFFLDAVSEMYLWQGWWPLNPDESDTALTTGSAEFRWHRDRRLAMQSIQSYADIVGRQMSKSYVVNSGLEPVEFRAFFPFWEDRPDVTQVNLQKGEVDGKKTSLLDLLAKLSRDRYTLAELQVRPLPEGVDPSKMEVYLSDEEFKDVFKMTKEEFTKLPNWKKLDHRKNAGLF